MTQQPRETCYHIARHRRNQTHQRCARRRATPRSNAHVDAIARDLDVMASATAIFFSPASSMALLGAALAPEDVHLFEVCFARVLLSFSICCSRDLRRRPRAGPRLRRGMPPDATARSPSSRARRCGAAKGRGAWAPHATVKSHKRGGGRYGVVAVVASELTQVTTF